jgi:hypothetical protein
MINVIPSVPMATMTVWVKMILKLAPVKKYGRTVGLKENRPITNTRPKNGPKILKKRLDAAVWLG